MLAFVLPLVMLGGGCATASRPSVPAALFDDASFARPAAMVDRRSLFALSPAMRGFLENYTARRGSQRGPRAGLAAALYDRGQLKIDYDSAFTRTAAEAFEDRA